jgi:hypothetical protein
MSEKLSFLGGVEPSEPEVAATGAAVAEAVQASVAVEAPVAGETPTVQTPAVQVVEAGQVPISALLDEREKRQAERAAREALERQLAAISAQANPPQPATPAEAVQAALYQQNLRSSRRFAEREHGKDTVATVHDWAARRCDEDPRFNQRMRAAEDPYEAAYQAYNRSQLEPLMTGVKPDDFAAFKAWQAAQAAGGATPSTVSHSPSPATPVPRTLATAPGNGGAGVAHVPVGPGQAFAATINR